MNEAMMTAFAMGRNLTLMLLSAAMPGFRLDLRAPRSDARSGGVGSWKLKAEFELEGEMAPAEIWASTGVPESHLQLA
jgi:hypothetical protein